MSDPALTAATDQLEARALHCARLTVRYRKSLRRGGFNKSYTQSMADEFHRKLIRRWLGRIK